MLRFLSKFNLATRIYTGFLVLGCYAVLLSFAALFAVGYVHKEYTKANSVIESTRQMSALETYLFSLNKTLFFFTVKGTETEKKDLEDAFKVFEQRAQDIKGSLQDSEIQEKYTKLLNAVLEKYRADMEEMFSLYEKSGEAGEKIARFADLSSEKLTALIEDTALPSASFALNGLREQLDAVLKAVEVLTIDDDVSQKQLLQDLAALKKAQTDARQAEMVNTKQLKAVTDSLKSLDEEINRKLKIDAALREKMVAIASAGDVNAKNFKELIDLMALSSARMLSDAESGKISLQKVFVFCAGFAGFLTVLLSFLSLFGIKYPLTRLVENAQEMARGNRSVLIHFTERDDEVGALARALAILLVHLKEIPVLTEDALLGKKSQTYGASVAYVPLGAANSDSPADGLSYDVLSDDFAYFGQGVGVDAESQLCQMLALIQHIGGSASNLTGEAKERFEECRIYLSELTQTFQAVLEKMGDMQGRMEKPHFEEIKDSILKTSENLNGVLAEVEDSYRLVEGEVQSLAYSMQLIERTDAFVSDLLNWIRMVTDLGASIQKNAAETKILALNASIEAAKAGEKAKAFGNVAMDMRLQTQKTTDTSEQLITNLQAVRQETKSFSEVMEKVLHELHGLHQSVVASLPKAAERVQALRKAIETAEDANADLDDAETMRLGFTPALEQMKREIEEAERKLPFVETQIIAVEQKISSFVSALPTYEEQKDNIN